MPIRHRQLSILRLMVLVAIAGASLGFLQAIPRDSRAVPTFWILLGVVDFVAVWKLVLARPLRAAHYVFLIVFLIGAIVLMTQVAMERMHPLGFLVRRCQELTGRFLIVQLREFMDLGEFWVAAAMAFLFAWAFGALAGLLERRRGWDIAAVCRGALLGFALASLFGVIQHAALGPEGESILANWAALALGTLVFGWLGRSRWRSSYLADRDRLGPIS